MARIVVIDSSPLIGLAIADGLKWLPELFSTVFLPESVKQEVLPGEAARGEEARRGCNVSRKTGKAWRVLLFRNYAAKNNRIVDVNRTAALKIINCPLSAMSRHWRLATSDIQDCQLQTVMIASKWYPVWGWHTNLGCDPV